MYGDDNVATYTGGLKINDKELKRYVDNAIGRTVTKAIETGDYVNKQLRRSTVRQWFVQNKFPNSYHTLYKSLYFEKPKVKQRKTLITIDFTSGFDSRSYDIGHTSLYRQREKYGNIDATAYIVESLQWNRGIIGLPAHSDFGYTNWENKHFHQFQSLQDYTYWKYKYNWKKKVNSYWKVRGNQYIKTFSSK